MFYNRMASPKVLEQEEKAWTVGAVSTFDEDLGAYNVQPVISYRSGLGNNREFGATIYGIYFPGLVLDWKKNYSENNGKYLTGDISIFGGALRPFGAQYDLIYGTADLYGSIGVNLVGLDEFNSYGNASLGWEFGDENRYGLQVGYAFGSLTTFERGVLSVGFKMDFVRTKKKYRE